MSSQAFPPELSNRPPTRWWHWVVGRHLRLTLLRLALAYVIMLGLIYWLQDYLIYHPVKISPEQELANALPGRYRPYFGPPGTPEFRGWLQRYDGGLLGHTEDGASEAKGTAVVVHGNAGLAIWSHHYGQMLEPLGYNVLLYEYPGYASREGKPSEASIVPDLRETVRRLEAAGLGPVYLIGESLGCGAVAAAVADPSLPVKGVFLGTPWDTLPDVAAARFWFLPVRHLVRDRYDSIRNLSEFDGPVFVLIAEKDRVLPPAHGRRLYDSLPGPKERVVVPTGHNGWFYQTHPAFWRGVMDFLARPEATSPGAVQVEAQ